MNEIKQYALDNAQNVSWVGATVGAVGALSLTEWLAIGGFLLALFGAAVNFWHKRVMVDLERKRFDIETGSK